MTQPTPHRHVLSGYSWFRPGVRIAIAFQLLLALGFSLVLTASAAEKINPRGIAGNAPMEFKARSRGRRQIKRNLVKPAAKPATSVTEIHGGIEIGSKGVKAVVIKVGADMQAADEGYKLNKLFEGTQATTIMRRDDKNRFTPEAISDTANAVKDYYRQMIEIYKVPSANIHIVGSSGLNAVNPNDLRSAIKERVGKDLDGFLTPEDEVTMLITGTIPRFVQAGKRRNVPNREQSVLIDIGSGNTKGGYRENEVLAANSFNYATFDIRQATVTFTTTIEKEIAAKNLTMGFSQVARTLADSLLRKPLHDAVERKPGLINRPRVYLSGGIIWAMVTLLHPEAIENDFVQVTTDDIRQFREMVASNQAELMNPNLEKKIPDAEVRAKAEKDLNNVRKIFTPNNLIAGAEILSSISDELSLKNRRVRFARQGVWGWLLSYTALQSGATEVKASN